MNYSHIFHAGNFADVLKHSILIVILKALKEVKKPFFVLDTHSGRGRYNLLAPEVMRSKEIEAGIMTLRNKKIHLDFIKDYLQTIDSFNHGQNFHVYPGSPAIIQSFLRSQDNAAFCELDEKEFFKLHGLMNTDKRVKTIRGDGYEALCSFLPPPEKYGLVLIDPPFEKKEEMCLLEDAIFRAIYKWQEGTFMLWYPVKDYHMFDIHYAKLQAISKKPVMAFTLTLPEYLAKTENSLRETAVIVINPPLSLVEQKEKIDMLHNEMFGMIPQYKMAQGVSC